MMLIGYHIHMTMDVQVNVYGDASIPVTIYAHIHLHQVCLPTYIHKCSNVLTLA